jgi:hypothetical protein
MLTPLNGQAAIGSLMLAAELGGPTMFARIGVMRALNHHVERAFDPSRKDKHWGRRTKTGRYSRMRSDNFFVPLMEQHF